MTALTKSTQLVLKEKVVPNALQVIIVPKVLLPRQQSNAVRVLSVLILVLRVRVNATDAPKDHPPARKVPLSVSCVDQAQLTVRTCQLVNVEVFSALGKRQPTFVSANLVTLTLPPL